MKRLKPRMVLACATLATFLVPAVNAAPPREGVDVGGTSWTTRLVPAEQIEQSSAQEYRRMLQAAQAHDALAGGGNPQIQRLRHIGEKLIPHAYPWNSRAKDWHWEVNLIGNKQINAFCMPGGKIAFFTGIIDQLKLSDDEIAMVMGHEIAHALREHARERMAKQGMTAVGTSIVAQLFGLGYLGQSVTNYGARMLTLEFSREDESEADLVGMELAARAGYDPRAGVTLWQKMGAATGGNKGSPYFSTHPSNAQRIRDIEANLPKVMPLYARAAPEKAALAPPYAPPPAAAPSKLRK